MEIAAERIRKQKLVEFQAPETAPVDELNEQLFLLKRQLQQLAEPDPVALENLDEISREASRRENFDQHAKNAAQIIALISALTDRLQQQKSESLTSAKANG